MQSDTQNKGPRLTRHLSYDKVDYRNLDHILWLKNTAVDSSSTGILFLNPGGRITYANDAALKIFRVECILQTAPEIKTPRLFDFL
jgi:PAS domain-containing protein